MSKNVNMHEAKTQLSRLVQALRDGHEREAIIAVSGKPSARLVPYEPLRKRTLGIDRGLFTIGADFDADDVEIANFSTAISAFAAAALPAIHADTFDRVLSRKRKLRA